MSFYSAHVYYACLSCGLNFEKDFADLESAEGYPEEVECPHCDECAYEDGADVWEDGDQIEAAAHSGSHCPECGQELSEDAETDSACGYCGEMW